MNNPQTDSPDAEELAGELRQSLDGLPNNEFKHAAITALQAIIIGERNRVESLYVLSCCISAYLAGDATTAKLLMYISGAIQNEHLCHATLSAIAAAQAEQQVILPPDGEASFPG